MQVLQSVVARFAHAAHLNSELKGTIKYVIEPFQFLNRRIHRGLADRRRFRKRKIKHVTDYRRIKSIS